MGEREGHKIKDEGGEEGKEQKKKGKKEKREGKAQTKDIFNEKNLHSLGRIHEINYRNLLIERSCVLPRQKRLEKLVKLEVRRKVVAVDGRAFGRPQQGHLVSIGGHGHA